MSITALQKYNSKWDSQCKKSEGRSLTMTDVSVYGVFVDNESIFFVYLSVCINELPKNRQGFYSFYSLIYVIDIQTWTVI